VRIYGRTSAARHGQAGSAKLDNQFMHYVYMKQPHKETGFRKARGSVSLYLGCQNQEQAYTPDTKQGYAGQSEAEWKTHTRDFEPHTRGSKPTWQRLGQACSSGLVRGPCRDGPFLLCMYASGPTGSTANWINTPFECVDPLCLRLYVLETSMVDRQPCMILSLAEFTTV
jgi:hypothetical protein